MAADAGELAEAVEGAQAVAVAVPIPMVAAVAVLTTIHNWKRWHCQIIFVDNALNGAAVIRRWGWAHHIPFLVPEPLPKSPRRLREKHFRSLSKWSGTWRDCCR